MFGPKVKLSAGMHERLVNVAEQLGCSVEEIVEKALERELDRIASASKRSDEPSQAEVDDIMDKLKGLGYID